MGLDFYVIKNSKNNKIKNSINFEMVTVSERLGHYIYENRHLIDDDISFFLSIDPYSDTKLLNIKEIKRLNTECDFIVKSRIMSGYEYDFEEDFEEDFFEKLYLLTDFCIINGLLLAIDGD